MKTFTVRVTVRFALLVTAMTAVVLTVGGFLLDRQIEAGLDRMHLVEADELAGLLGTDGAVERAEIARRIKYDADSDSALFVMQVSDRQGTVLFRSDNLAQTILPIPENGAGHRTAELPYLGATYLSTFLRGPWRIQIGSVLQPAQRMLEEYIRVAVALLVLTAAISVCMGYAFSRDTLRPVRAIETTAKRIRAEDLTERIPVTSAKDELAGLSLLLNQMFDRLQHSFDEVRRFTADASHELKTPLSLIRLSAERLRARLRADAEANAAVGDILEEVARIQQVIDRLLFLAKADSGALQPVLQAFDTRGFLADLSADAEVLAEDRGARFTVSRNEAGEFRGDAELLRQMVLNLITNAVAVSPSGALVTIESRHADRTWTLTVIDEGPGMPAEHIAHAFERFVRFEQRGAGSASVSTGHGLGLPICKSIAELHHGTIRMQNRDDGRGLRVEIRLPNAATHPLANVRT